MKEDDTFYFEIGKGNVPGTTHCDCSPRTPKLERASKLTPAGKPYMYFWLICTKCVTETFREVDGKFLRVVESRVLEMWDNPPE